MNMNGNVCHQRLDQLGINTICARPATAWAELPQSAGAIVPVCSIHSPIPAESQRALERQAAAELSKLLDNMLALGVSFDAAVKLYQDTLYRAVWSGGGDTGQAVIYV